MKIVFLDSSTLGNSNLDSIRELGELTEYDYTEDVDTVERSLEADIVITNKVVFTKDILNKLPNLKLICIAATGMNNVDLEAAKELGVEVKNVSGYSTNSVAQHTFAMLLHLVQKNGYFDNYTSSKQWQDSEIFTHLGQSFNEISGKKWGIIGLGTIGTQVAHIAKAFGCEVNFYSTSGKNNNPDFNKIEIEELLRTSDIISVHCALTENTKYLLSISNLNLLQDHCVLLNLSRGPVIQESDLVEVFKKKNISIGLDVTDGEPISKDSPLNEIIESERVFITPHIAWSSVEARETLVSGIVKNIKNKFFS